MGPHGDMELPCARVLRAVAKEQKQEVTSAPMDEMWRVHRATARMNWGLCQPAEARRTATSWGVRHLEGRWWALAGRGSRPAAADGHRASFWVEKVLKWVSDLPSVWRGSVQRGECTCSHLGDWLADDRLLPSAGLFLCIRGGKGSGR